MESMTRIIHALETENKVIKRVGGKTMAQCPAHPDRNPSLAISHTGEATLLKCFAGCDTQNILAALGMTFTDLFDKPLETTESLIGYQLQPVKQVTQPSSEPQIWVYENQDRQPHIRIIKTYLDNGKKTFRQQHWRDGQWHNGLAETQPILYRLPDVIDVATRGGIIAICEGEKDADTFNQQTEHDYLIATTAPMGAGKWRDFYNDALTGATEIWLIPDLDEIGIKHATTIDEQLKNLGFKTCILAPATGKDLTEHIEAGYTIDDLIDNQQAIDNAKTAAAQAKLDKAIEAERLIQTARDLVRKELHNEKAANRYTLPIYAKTLTEELQKPDEAIQFVIDQLWPVGANISLTATYKAGKTSTINNIIKALADGLHLFDHFQTNHTGRICFMNYEVSENQMRKWIREIGIRNTDAVTLINMRGHTWPFNSDHVIEQTIKMLQDNETNTWIIDPLARAFVGSGDENSNQDVGIFLDTIDYIKDQAGIKNCLIAAHTGRNAEQGNSRARGASRFDDWVDARWMLTKDNDGQRWFTADGRDVLIEESRLDWDETERKQKIAININRKQTAENETEERVLTIIKNAGFTGINKADLVRTYKSAYGKESLSSESVDGGTLGKLKNLGLIFEEKIGNSKVFKAVDFGIQIK